MTTDPGTIGGDQQVRAQESSRAELDRAALGGAAWMGAAKWSTQLVSWAGTILVARILVPGDYGIVAMATIYLGLLSLVSEFGIGITIVSHRQITEAELEQLNTVALLMGLASFFVSTLAARPLGWFFGSEALPLVVVVMSLTFAINATQIVPLATLRREMKFRTLALIDVTRGFLVPIGTLVLAYIGLRYWALVGGAILSSVVGVAMTIACRRHGFAIPAWHRLRGKLTFSSEILVSRLAWFTYSNADFAIAGRRLGEGALGDYSMAFTLATTPTSKVYGLLTDVTPALFAAVQDDRAALRRYLLNMTELLGFVCWPAAAGLSLVAHDLVAILLGSKWSGAATPLMLLAALSIIRAVTPLYGYLFAAVGQSRYSMWTSLAAAVVMPIAFYAGSYWGTTGIALSWLIAFPLVTLVTFSRVQRILSLSLRDYLHALRLGFDGSLAMCVAVIGLRSVLNLDEPLLRLITDATVGAAVFTATTFALHRSRIFEIVNWFRRTRAST